MRRDVILIDPSLGCTYTYYRVLPYSFIRVSMKLR